MKPSRIDIGSIRREQIVAAAAAIIAEQGIQNLSLSVIEKKVGMSRGQLTYWFPAKEDILLAVFDRMLEMMCRQHGKPERPEDHPWFRLPWLEALRQLLGLVLVEPPEYPEFHALQYTFLSQIGHREDFRRRLADLYEKWRAGMTRHLERDLADQPAQRSIRPRALATLVQALIHGLAMQRAADPQAFDPAEIIDLCLDLLGSYLARQAPESPTANTRKTSLPAENKTLNRRRERNGSSLTSNPAR